MEFFVIRTALPFGYLAGVLGLLALVAIGALLTFGGIKRQERWQLGAGLALLAVVGLVVWANIRAGAIDWNPLVREEQMLHGAWRDGRSVLTLEPDGQFRCTGRACTELGARGRWRRAGDFELVFEGGAGGWVTRRLARDGQYLYLVAGTSDFDDPDMWRPRFTFARPVLAT